MLFTPFSKSTPTQVPFARSPPDAGAILMKPTTSTSIATPQGSPAPAEQSSPKSGATKRQRKAAAVPLGDVTNLLLPDTPTPTKPRRTGRRPLPPPSDASAASSTCSSSASVTPAPKRSSAAVLEEESSLVKSPAISTVYTSRRTTGAEVRRRNPVTNKGKAPVAAPGTASCPQLGKSTRNNKKTSMAQDTRPISSSASCHRETKKKRSSSSTFKLPEDFVKKQKAYFADIDAFELPEEEVSETDLE